MVIDRELIKEKYENLYGCGITFRGDTFNFMTTNVVTEEQNGYQIMYDGADRFPTKEISILIGLDIHTDWVMPETMTGVETLKVADVNLEEAVIHYEELLKLNPILSNIPTDKPFSILDIVNGCISRFNYDDIHYYVTVNVGDRVSNDERDIIEEHINAYFSSVTSPQTISRVKEHLNLS